MEDKDEDIYSFDPFSIFLVKPSPCHIVKVKVIRGRNITKGKLADTLDTPDPYVKVYIPTSKCGKRQTAHKQNTHEPEWNEEFTFYIDPEVKNILHVELWESELILDQELDGVEYDLDQLELGQTTQIDVQFKRKSAVDLEVLRINSEKPDLRHGLTLCDSEKDFLRQRKRKVYDAMRDVLGEEGPENLAEVPVIGVLGSGGGLRAMTGFSGVISALHEVRILDMVTYISALSGSSWYLGLLYSDPDWPDKDPGSLQDKLKHKITTSAMKTSLSPSFIKTFMDDVKAKKKRQQPISLTDYLGHMLGTVFLKDRMNACLSDQREKVRDGRSPLPLYTSIRVKPNVSATQYQEWVEYSPYEISMLKHGISLPPELLNSRFYLGRLMERYPETKMHFLLAIFGSAFAIQLARLAEGEENKKTATDIISKHQDGSPSSKRSKDTEDSDDSDDEHDHDDNMNNMDKDDSLRRIPTINVNSTEHICVDLDSADGDGTTEVSPQSSTTSIDHEHSGSHKGSNHDLSKDHLSVGQKLINSVLRSKALNSRSGRAALISNFLSGVKLPARHAFSPFSRTGEEEEDIKLTNAKRLCMVDAGLCINLPIPPLVKPQRQVDLILSFDFSHRASDNAFPFQDLLDTEEWARAHGVPFPPITVTKESVSREGIKECYVFRDPQNDLCPIVVHFVLINESFRRFKRPGMPRETEEEKEFGNFSIFDDKDDPYSTFATSYSEKVFERLSKLTAYNTLNHAEVIHGAIIECVNRKRQKAKAGGIPWEVSRITSMGAVNFSNLERNSFICNEGLEKVEILMGKKDNDVYLRRYRLPRMEGMLEDAPDSDEEESLGGGMIENEGDDNSSSVKEEEGEYQGIGGECGCGDEDCCHNPVEEVERVIQMRKASQGQGSYKHDPAQEVDRASYISRKPFDCGLCCTVL